MPAFDQTRPPGRRKPFTSHGACALPPALIQSLAAVIEIGRRHDVVDQLHGLGALDLQRLALGEELQRIGGRDHARDALGAAAAGKQADLHFRQAEPRFRIIGGDAVMARKCDLEAAAHGGAVERADPRLAAGLQPPAQHRQSAAFLEHHFGRGFFALARERIGVEALETLQDGEIGAAAERGLAGGDDRALDRLVARDLLDERPELFVYAGVDDVHRPARHVPGDERDAIGVDVEGEVGHWKFPQ